MRLGSQTVTITRPSSTTTIDEYGNHVPATYTSWDVPGCSVQPAGGSTYVRDRSQTTTTMLAWLPPTADVADTDTITFGGMLWEIDGPVDRWLVGSPLDHLVVRLRRSQG